MAPPPHLVSLAQWIGIMVPAIYAGMTVQDSLAVRTFLAHATQPKILAKQWLHMYQRRPYWVVPTVAASTTSNIYLAWRSSFAQASEMRTPSAL
ncbi:hypothetical protein B0T14DRAFT_563342 [Immersiella caudata]|uniref:Uncharacterized protein n=1 Tax=Immersiella caudata TaxID=314043 RepID=A0AA40C7Y9_9PEZI|nr:hypothetical protein B0T14DRAFT_563342 [Immersiella caudata]